MSYRSKYQRWRPDFTSLDNTTLKARDVIVRCFFEAQKETFARSKEKLGVESNDDKIMKSVRGLIRIAFNSIEGDFENPTKDQLLQVVQILARKAKFMGTPPDIIAYHSKQIEELLSRMP